MELLIKGERAFTKRERERESFTMSVLSHL